MAVILKTGYCIYERSSDGLLKDVEFDEGYGHRSYFYNPYDTEEAALKAIEDKVKYEKRYYRRNFVILKEITAESED